MEKDKFSETIKNTTLCTLKVQRVTQGIKVFCRSQQIEDFFASMGTGSSNAWGEMTQGSYSFSFEQLQDCYFSKWGESFEYNSKPNLSFLRAKGLGEGISLTFSFVVSTDRLTQWAEKARRAIKTLWLQYLKPVEIEISISTRDMEV